MVMVFNVLSSVMELRVLHNGNGGLVVDEECSGRVKRVEEFCEKSSEPDGFFGCVSSGNVLGFESVMEPCFFELQEIVPPASMNT